MKTINKYYYLTLQKDGHSYRFKFMRSTLDQLYWELIIYAASSKFNITLLDVLKLINKISAEFKKGTDDISFLVTL